MAKVINWMKRILNWFSISSIYSFHFINCLLFFSHPLQILTLLNSLSSSTIYLTITIIKPQTTCFFISTLQLITISIAKLRNCNFRFLCVHLPTQLINPLSSCWWWWRDELKNNWKCCTNCWTILFLFLSSFILCHQTHDKEHETQSILNSVVDLVKRDASIFFSSPIFCFNFHFLFPKDARR